MPPGTPSAAPSAVAAGTLTVGVGLAVLGLSATVFLVLSARAVGPREFASLSTLWTLVYTFGIGAFLPFEQELARALARRAGQRRGGAPVAIRAALAAAAVLAGLLAATAVAAPLLVDRLFAGHRGHLLALAAAMAVLAGQYVTRGIFAGTGLFRWYSAQLGIEGIARIAACAALLAAGVHTTAPFAGTLAAAPLLSLLLTAPRVRGALRPGPPAPWPEVSAHLGWLLVGAVCAQAVANAAVVALRLLAPHGDAAGRFLAAFVIARIPLFLFQAVQAVLLPGLSRALATADRARFHRELRRVLTATALVGAAGVAGAAAAGPAALRLAFGAGFTLGRIDIVVLAAGTGLYMVALVFQSGLLALARHRDTALGWATALGVFVACCLVPLTALARVELALTLSCAAAAALLGLRLTLGVRRATARNTPSRPAARRETRKGVPS
jgi:O-antigen/teichoic acid export membrane protein